MSVLSAVPWGRLLLLFLIFAIAIAATVTAAVAVVVEALLLSIVIDTRASFLLLPLEALPVNSFLPRDHGPRHRIHGWEVAEILYGGDVARERSAGKGLKLPPSVVHALPFLEPQRVCIGAGDLDEDSGALDARPAREMWGEEKGEKGV